jgi:hypothetical protein
MPLRGAYAAMRPEFDPFLFAPIGEEVDGIPIERPFGAVAVEPRSEG